MVRPNKKLVSAVEAYFGALRRVRATGVATGERSYYPALEQLLRAVGASLKPKVFCVQELADQGAGHPDFALFTAKQIQKGRPRPGQVPERGVVEVKGVGEDAQITAESPQVTRYLDHYRLVLVTNLRDFVLVGVNGEGNSDKLEKFQLADNEDDFWHEVETPRAFAAKLGARLGEYLARVLSHRVTLTEPKDLAWLLASYARDGLARVEAAGSVPALSTVRSAMEEALGIRFKDERGEHLFRSTLIQTLFYGMFSAWVLWSRGEEKESNPPSASHDSSQRQFRWREGSWYLRVPVLRVLFSYLTSPGQLKPLDLVEVLEWTSEALDRVDRTAFFSRFNEGEAVQYFYEPFLEAFDPALRKQLGVWYTPTEVVRYMVARVDKTLKDDLGIPEGLAADNVFVLDPCCGTGAYLAEVLRRIADNLGEQGLGALVGEKLKEAATKRVFGFEIMPAPFVVAHLQVGLTIQNLGAPLAEDESERAGVFLTNALTGWVPSTNKPLPFRELEEERDRAEEVKQKIPILVILGNPPYNGFAGMAVDEERELLEAYRTVKDVQRPTGQGLNDLYVRFFRMAERRIAKKAGLGVICFISNYSWLDGLSFTGMRERYLRVFDAIRVDCLNGDVRKGGKTPFGDPDASIFTVPGKAVGIQVGTAIATLVRKPDHKRTQKIGFRHLWGQSKPAELTATADADPDKVYSEFEPSLKLGLPFMETAVSPDWFDWPAFPDLFLTSFPGVKTSRDGFLVDTDLDRLQARVGEYFNPVLSHEEIARSSPGVMKSTAGFNARAVRTTLMKREKPDESGFVRFAYRPFDNRWLYWEKDTKLLDRNRAKYKKHVFEGNRFLVAQKKSRREWSPPQVISPLGCLDLMDRGATCFPLWLREERLVEAAGAQSAPNLSRTAQRYLDRLGLGVEDLFHHVLATLHDPVYQEANVDALRMGWPRIPLPGWPDGDPEGASQALARSAERGRKLAALLDSEQPVSRETLFGGNIALPSTISERQMAGKDLTVTAGWGHIGAGSTVKPRRGLVVEREYKQDERAGLARHIAAFGETTFDVYLNKEAYWSNVPAAIWNYRLGGYQVLKKWLSYREYDVLGRKLHWKEIKHFTDTARRIGTLLAITNSDDESRQ